MEENNQKVKSYKIDSKTIIIICLILIMVGIGAVFAKDYLFQEKEDESTENETKVPKLEDEIDEEEPFPSEFGEEDYEGADVHNFSLISSKPLTMMGDFWDIFDASLNPNPKKLFVIEAQGFGEYIVLMDVEENSRSRVKINDNLVPNVVGFPAMMKVVGDILHVQYHNLSDICCGVIVAYDKQGKELYRYDEIENDVNYYIHIDHIEVNNNNDVVVVGYKILHASIWPNWDFFCDKTTWLESGIKESTPIGGKFQIKYLGNYKFSKPVLIEAERTFEQYYIEEDCDSAFE